jgi:hypothetical protein
MLHQRGILPVFVISLVMSRDSLIYFSMLFVNISMIEVTSLYNDPRLWKTCSAVPITV